MSKAAAAAASSAHKRKRADGSSFSAPAAGAVTDSAAAPDLAQWMRDVISAPVAPEDQPDPTEEQSRALPADAIVEDESESDEEVAGTAGSASSLAALSLAAGAGAGAATRPSSSAIPRSHFGSVRDLFTCLTSSKGDTVFSGLVRFHRQIKDETTFGPSSSSSSSAAAAASGTPGVSLLAQYWSLSPDAKELFSILDNFKSFDPKKQNQILGKVFDVFSRMILPSSLGFDYTLANNLIRRVVRSKHFGVLTRITKMQDQRLVHSGLTFMLHTVICCGSNVTHLAGVGAQAGGKAAAAVAVVEPTGPKAPSRGSNALLREFVMKFEWSAKWFLEIPTKPFAAHGASAAAGSKKAEKAGVAAAVAHTEAQQTMLIHLSKSRLLYIHILVELLAKRDLTITSYLLGIKGYVTSVLKNLKNDPTTAGHLDALLHGFVHNILYLPGLSAQAKFGFFNSYVLEHLMELFRPRTNLVLLSQPTAGAVAGRKKKGVNGGLKAVSSKEALELIERTLREFISYLSKHQVSASVAVNMRHNRVALVDSASQATSIKQHGPLLLRILHSLHANESAAEQRLLLDILSSFPVALLGEFLAHFSYTFDPRPSFRWVNHVALICKIWDMRWEQKLAALAQTKNQNQTAGSAPAFIGGAASKAAQVEDEFVMLHPLQPLGVKSSSSSSSSAAASASSNGAAVPTLFAFLLPSTLSQRIILSQCIQHSSSLVKYTTLNMLRSLLLRFEQLSAEYEREWRRAQGISAQAPRPAMLQAALASCRSHLAKILPDIQVLFGLRTKLLPAQSLTIEEMQAELEGPEDAESAAGAEVPSKKARVVADSKQQQSKAAEDSATSDQSVESTAELALKSRHVVYSRFLAVLASYARALPEALLEGRIDVFKLLPASLSGVGGSAQPSLSWWGLNELMDVLGHASAWKHTRLFGLTQQTKSSANQPADPAAVALVPLSYWGQMLRQYHALCDPDSDAATLLMVNGHESVLSTGGDRPSQASPARVTERVKVFLTQVLLHTGLFSSASAAAAGNTAGAYNRSAFEEIHLWLSSLRTAADLRFFEHLVAHLVNSNSVAGAWTSKDESQSGALKAASEVKLSILLSTACSSSFQAYFISATPYAEVEQLSQSLTAMLSRFMARAVASPTMGPLIHEQLAAALEARTVAVQTAAAAGSSAAPKKAGSNALFASLPSTLPALLKHLQSSKVASAAAATPGSLESFQAALTSLRAKPSSKSGAELVVRLATEHFAVPHRAESTKGVLLAYAREALLALLGSGASSAEAGALAVWKAIAAVIRSAEFEAPIPEAAPLSAEHCECTPTVAAARLAVVLAPSVSGAAGAALLKDHFHPAAEDALTKQVASFLLSLPLATSSALHELAAPMLNAVVQACLALGKTAAPELLELPFTLQLLQQCLPLLSSEQLASVSHALCDPATAWVLRIASVPASASASAANLGEQLLQHGGANSIQMLAGMLMASASKGAVAEKKKSSKKAAAAPVSSASPLVLERLLLKLLSSSNDDASLWLSQLQPAFFAFCLESITAPAAGAASSSSSAGSEAAGGPELFAELAALFLSSEVSSLYVALFVKHVSQRFGSESEDGAEFDEAAQAELVQLLPLLVRAASSSHLALVGAEQASWFVSFVLRALSQALLPYFLAHHAAASKASAAPAAVARLEAITELVRVVALSGSFAEQFSVEKRQQLLQFVLTGSKPELIGSASAASATSKKAAPARKQSSKQKKKKQSSKMTDSDSSSSSSSDSDSDEGEDDGDVSMSSAVPAADSKYEVFDSLRFSLAHTLLTAVPASSPVEISVAVAEGVGAAPASVSVRASLAQCYCHLLSQAFSTLSKGLKAAAKTKEAHAAVVAAASKAMLGGDFDMTAAASKPVKGLLSPEFERRLLAALNELLSTGMDSTFLTHSATPAAKTAKWVSMLPLSSLLRESPNAALSAQLLGAYSKLFPSLLRYAYTSLPHQTLLRNSLLLQLSGVFSRGVFLSRIVSLRGNMHFTTVIEGGEEEEGEAQEEPEVPSLLSICALASSPDAENFQPLSVLGGNSKGADQEALRDAAAQVPTAQAIFELMVSHSKFVAVIAPGAVARDEAEQEDEEDEDARAGAAQALQLEFLRILLLLFSFPDSSPPADFSLQSNLWLLLLSQFHASISASDSYIKLLLDLFEEIALGAAARKRHKKMEFELIVSQRKWGDAGLAALTSRMSDGDAASVESQTLTNQDPALWLYTNFNAAMLYKGPIVSRMPASRIQSHVAAASAGVAEQAIIPEQPSAASEDPAAATAAPGMVDDTSSSSDLRYDPSFLLPFLHHFLVHHAADLRKLIELNLLGYVIQCMSHQSLSIRKMAYATMGKFQAALESANEKLNAEKAAEKKAAEEAASAAATAAKKADDASDSDDEIGGSRSKRGLPPLTPVAPTKLDKTAKGSKTWEAKKALYHDAHRSRSSLAALGPDGQPLLYAFKEYPQISLLLTSLKNGITQKFQSVPHIVSTFLARILPILLRPDHALYKIVNRFLLARPLLDLSDIPLFYNLFQSSAPGDAFRFQRNFILKVLRDGFSTPGDYPLVHRRHVATILMAYVSNRSLSDKYTRGHSLQMMEGGLSASPNFLAEILRVHALFPWIHAQLLATNQSNQWAPGLVPILRVLDRACLELRGKIPAQPEEDVVVEAEGEAALVEEEDAAATATGKEADEDNEAEDSSSSSSSSDSDSDDDDAGEKKKRATKSSEKAASTADEDANMKDADSATGAASSTMVLSKKRTAAGAPKSRIAKAPLSPEAEALKALRKRQRQRAQISRELNLLVEALATKFHEFCWTERIVSVVAPSAGAHTPVGGSSSSSSAPALQPLSTQLSVVEFVLSLLLSMLQTSAKAHVASKRLTNRVQLLTEGRVGGGVPAGGWGPMDQFAPFAFRPSFLESLSTLPSASATLGSKLSATALDHLTQLLLLSSPTPVIPTGMLGMVSSVVADAPKDVTHLLHTIRFHARAVLSGSWSGANAQSTHVHALLEWLSLLLEFHPRVLLAWWSPAPQSELTRLLIGAYRVLAGVSDTRKASRSTTTLNAILVRILGVGTDAAVVDKALSVAPLSPAQRQAYSSAVSALSSHAVPLFTATPSGADSSPNAVMSWTRASPSAVAAVQWTNAFASLLLQELCAMQMEHATHAARVTAPAAGPARQSAAFAMLAATRSAVDKEAGDGWSEAQRSIVKALKSAAAAFA